MRKDMRVYCSGDNWKKARGSLTDELTHISEGPLKGPYGTNTNHVNRVPFSETVTNFQNASVKVSEGKTRVTGRVVPNIWLRDNCQCDKCKHSATKQRLIDTFSIPEDISIKSHIWVEDDMIVKIEWSDGHWSTYSRDFLHRATAHPASKALVSRGLRNVVLWDSTIGKRPPMINYDDMDRRIRPFTNLLREYGFCYVDDTPYRDPYMTKELLEKIAFIRQTHYGGFYDFTSDLASKDTAYTNIALEAHTDTTYFSDPAGLQAFHLLSHTDGEGGASLLVDGFKVAAELLETDPEAYKILSTVKVHAHASGNEGISIQPYRSFPVLEHDPTIGDLVRVRWNSSDRAWIDLPIEQVETWYRAARKFDALLKKKENEYWEQLRPGRVLIFDNWRVLHGRSSFTGKRRICGAYINRDDWISKYREASGAEMMAC
ncbi:TauD Probable taurine catabolism dioxygenase [Pyrenophora tritici-repentis]|uniref:Trimethyllysine dioxygenase n=2 Tax=Pyrenophora tritici-repentis TaxID=45151 RepID=A0A2W1H8N4_9PLEO|nr:trimethyllysine dioxygenase [Pyrenophora tritici-repentis Pt-1C-BFP]KAA8615519.1 trimethyllysine dioxygenase [Pyrenophora tritici-repentis]EDU51450.1 trimethyllysine dioxygenase [Pyrenophora tritici-repentis Pt-1C-BFP]KAF7443904.1 trimethyllysine dioxygenase [Pyrenophora tritici-repentis]KAF7566375.1 TauD, Probable taurine catabolism dioxygenase [Pyrenophora tritici-repentis]KAG9379640.1 trimethyllysine dioxygenase [Pyrenophora tritici-repentis]